MQRLEARLPITTAAPTAVVMQRWVCRPGRLLVLAICSDCCAGWAMQRPKGDCRYCSALGCTRLLGVGVRVSVLPSMG